MSIHTMLVIMLALGWVLGILTVLLVRYAEDYARSVLLSRQRAMRAHPAGGRGNLHVGTIHVPRSRGRDEVFDQMAGQELPPGWDLRTDEPLPDLPEWLSVPSQPTKRDVDW
jgi:hypothetical protein